MFRRNLKPRSQMFSPNQKVLPARFAERILQLEMDLDYFCNLNTLKQLLELYSQAVEYFESLNDPRHMQYQERMQNLLMRRDVLAVMNGETTNTKQKTEKDLKRHKEENDFNRKMRAQRMNRQLGVKHEERSAERMVDKQLNSSFNSSQVIRNDLKTQKDRINDKLQERIRQRTASPAVIRQRSSMEFAKGQARRMFDESDRSAGGSPDASKGKEDFESEFEKLMENFVEKKIIMVQEVKSRYMPQISELEQQKSEVVELVVENLRQQMNDEIAAGVIKLEEAKNKDIAELKVKTTLSTH